MIIECIAHNWLCKHMKKVRSRQATILKLNWVKQSFSLRLSLYMHGLTNGKWILTLILVNKHWRSYMSVKLRLLLILNLFLTISSTWNLNLKAFWNVLRLQANFSRTFWEYNQLGQWNFRTTTKIKKQSP